MRGLLAQLIETSNTDARFQRLGLSGYPLGLPELGGADYTDQRTTHSDLVRFTVELQDRLTYLFNYLATGSFVACDTVCRLVGLRPERGDP